MNALDQIIADALAGSPETHVAILAREVVRLREARAVVVPELTDDEIHARLLKLFPDADADPSEREWCFKDSRWAYNLAASRARAIPADRVLGEGMVAMNAIKRKCQNDDEDAIEALTFCGYGEQAELLEAAIRANQGGADHD